MIVGYIFLSLPEKTNIYFNILNGGHTRTRHSTILLGISQFNRIYCISNLELDMFVHFNHILEDTSCPEDKITLAKPEYWA